VPSGDHRGEESLRLPGGERAMVGSVGIDDPEIRVTFVGHRIGKAADVSDALPVGKICGSVGSCNWNSSMAVSL